MRDISLLLLELWPDRLTGIKEVVDNSYTPYEIIKPYRHDPIRHIEYSGVILSGGAPCISKIDEHPFLYDVVSFTKYAVKKNIPIFGVCLGYQILACAIGGKVAKGNPEIGYKNVYHHNTELLKDVQNPLPAFQYHFDEIVDLPKNTDVFATDIDSKIQAFKIKDKSCWGVQFHPEISRKRGIDILSERRQMIEGMGMNVDEMIHLGQEKYLEEQCRKVIKNYLENIKR